jgi:glycosyltransferase involved in cell wall biosynthesis
LTARPTVLFDARLVLEKPTGIGQYAVSLLPELLRLAPDWHFHLLRRPRPWDGYGLERWDAPNLTHHVSRLRHMSPAQHVVVPRRARALGAHLVHYPHFDAPVAFGGIPVVATLHDAKYIVRPELFPAAGRTKRAYMRICFARTVRRAAAVMTDSHATARDMHRLFGAPLERMDVVPLAADPRFRPASGEAQTEFRRTHSLSRPFVLSVGERRPHKNHAGLIRAWARSRGSETHDLVIVGQAFRDHDLPETVAAETGLADRVRFLEDIAPRHLVAAYSAAEVFVLVSHYEGFGLPILEAMACDTPVIASRTTASGEVLGDAGVGVDPENGDEIVAALDRLLASESERARWRERGRARAASFSWGGTAERTLEVYRRVLGAPAPIRSS